MFHVEGSGRKSAVGNAQKGPFAEGFDQAFTLRALIGTFYAMHFPVSS